LGQSVSEEQRSQVEDLLADKANAFLKHALTKNQMGYPGKSMQFNQTKRWFQLAMVGVFASALQVRAGLNIVPFFDASVTNAPNAADYMAGFNYAAQQFTSRFANNITVNIKVVVSGTGGTSGPAFTSQYTYAEIHSALVASSSLAVAGLPADDQVTNSHIYSLTVANAAAIGLTNRVVDSQLTGNDPNLAGVITLEGNPNYRFDPANPIPAVPVGVDFVGTAEHEISEVLGRTQGNFPSELLPFDLYRFTAPGVRGLTIDQPGVYFSIDQGATRLKAFNQLVSGGDLQDWDGADPTDAFNASGDGTVGTSMTPVDFTVMQAIGYSLIFTARPVLTLNVSGNTITLSWDATATGYTLESKASLTDPSWTTVGTDNPSMVAIAPGNAFFRLRK